jgi:hypothetical protein
MMHETKNIIDGYFEDIIEISRASSGTNYLRRAPVPAGYIDFITYVSVINETSSYTRLRIGKEVLGHFNPYYEEGTPAANEIYWTTEKFICREGTKVTAELTGVTLNDVLKMRVEGYRVKVR